MVLVTAMATISGCQRSVESDRPARRDVREGTDIARAVDDLVEDAHQAGLRGIVVLRDGKRIAEAYAPGVTGDTLHDVRSVGKSITSLLAGIAIDRGLIRSVDDPIGRYLSGFGQAPSQIKIRDLLTMQSGFAAAERDPSSPGHEDRLDEAPDALAFVRALPMTAAPGTVYRYASVNAFLVGAVVEAAARMPLDELARVHLFEPLGISVYEWPRSSGGHPRGQGNLRLSAHAAAALGQLVLDGGRDLVSARWIKDSLAPQVEIGSLDSDATSYGFMWYGTDVEIDGRRIAVRFASGNGGNKIYLIPELRAVIVITSSAYDRRSGQTRSKEILKKLLELLT